MRSVTRRLCRAALTAAFGLAGCVMAQPLDGETLPQTYSWTIFSGLWSQPSKNVIVEVQNRFSGAWEPFATLPTANEATIIDKNGKQYFPWGERVQVPQGERPFPDAGYSTLELYWKQIGGHMLEARTRARVGPIILDSLDAPDGLECLATEYGKTQVGQQAVAACRSKDPIVKVKAHCGNDWEACCLFAPTCASGAAQCKLGRCVRQIPIQNKTTHPSDDDGAWSDDLVQGVTHDASNWYITSTTQVFKIPVSTDLASGSFSKKVRPFKSFKHLGDPEYFDGVIYVPLENGPPSIGALDSDLNELGVAPIPGADQASWCAIHPESGRLYTSNSDAGALHVYRIHWDGGFSLEREFDVPLRLDAPQPVAVSVPVPGIQGGAFGPGGILYLISDVYEPYYPVAPYAGGILGVVAETGVPVAGLQIPYKPFVSDPTTCDLVDSSCRDEELEGVTFWDLSGGQAPGIKGNLHVMQVDNFPSRSYWFKHFSVTN